jgi:hypothetical protein
MGRSAFLPDASVLSDLLARVRPQPPDKPWNSGQAASVRPRVTARVALDEEPPTPRASVPPPRASVPPPRASVPPPRASVPPPRQPAQELLAQLMQLPTLDARFESFVTWLKAETNARTVFVADAEGLSMVQSDAGDGYLVAAGEISVLLENLSALLPDVDQGSTLLRLKTQGNVELVWCKTNLGRFTVGLVLEEPLAQKFVTVIRAALAMVTADGVGK